MNQDGLENFFGNVRSNCQVKKQPMAFQFRSAFTNLIVTNLTAKHSIRSNCQDDKGFALLQNVIDMYDMDCEESEDEFEDDEDILELGIDNEEITPNFLADEALVLESANACRDVLVTSKCDACKNTLEAYCPLTQHGILKKCEITSDAEKRTFTYPTVLFMSNFKLLFKKVQILLPFICDEKFLSRKLITSLDSSALAGLGCSEHSEYISQKIKKITVKLAIDMFRKEINLILRKKIVEPFENQHDIYNKAFKAQKHVGKHVQNSK